jgi:hypothetical protein
MAKPDGSNFRNTKSLSARSFKSASRSCIPANRMLRRRKFIGSIMGAKNAFRLEMSAQDLGGDHV